jgi:hypothetical protein
MGKDEEYSLHRSDYDFEETKPSSELDPTSSIKDHLIEAFLDAEKKFNRYSELF